MGFRNSLLVTMIIGLKVAWITSLLITVVAVVEDEVERKLGDPERRRVKFGDFLASGVDIMIICISLLLCIDYIIIVTCDFGDVCGIVLRWLLDLVSEGGPIFLEVRRDVFSGE